MNIDLSGRKVVVTGGGGFIGSHLCEMLVGLGADTTAYVHYNSFGRAGWLDHSSRRSEIRIVNGDVADADSVRNVVKGADIVFHLAALVGIPYSYQAPRSYVTTNIEGTLNVLQAARDEGVGRVIHTSTSEVYGTAREVPIPETHPLQAQSPYAASKIAADKLAEAMFNSFGLPVVTVRPFNTFGPRQSTRAIVPTIITQCLVGKQTIRLGNLHPTRDLNFVSDTARGFVIAGTRQGVEGRTYNLGSGREISIGDLAVMIAEAVGVEVHVETQSERLRPEGSEVDRLLADSRHAASDLGWQSEVPLEAGIEQTVAWLREHIKLYDVSGYSV